MIFPVFYNMAISHHVEFLKWQNFYLKTEPEGLRRITMPNFVEIGPFIVEKLQLFDFSNWPTSSS